MSSNNTRIAKNTLYLYVRTLLVMAVTLYTSRVVLDALGFQDFGVYQVVGGAVAMFGFLTNALSVSISRFITFELGRGYADRLQMVFTCSMRILVVLSVCVLFLGETLGLWLLNNWVNIPPDRMVAANWVWQSTLLVFILNLLSVPYNADIIAHEHMSTFATISILEVGLKLGVALALQHAWPDKLIAYALLMVGVALTIRLTYGAYCHRHFPECRWSGRPNPQLVREMLSFTGYSFFNHVPYILNTQAMTLLINQFFSVTVISARGIAHQVEAATIQLVSNFTTAVKPQITKTYASGEHDRMFMLICMGSKYGFFLMLFFSVPLIVETPYILDLWLGEVPPFTVDFTRLSLVSYLISMLGETGYTACQATGHIKRYTLVVSTVALLPLPLTWACYAMGFNVRFAYYTIIFTYALVNLVRLYFMKRLFGFPPMMFVRRVVVRVLVVAVPAFAVPALLACQMQEGLLRLVCTGAASVSNTCFWTVLLGLSRHERQYFITMARNRLSRL